MSHLWKKFQDEIEHHRKFTKKAPNFVWAPCGRYQDITHLLLNPKLPTNAMGFNNHNLSNKTLKHRALKIYLFYHSNVCSGTNSVCTMQTCFKITAVQTEMK